MNILLGVTGSVAATLTDKLLAELSELGPVQVIATNSAFPFMPKLPFEINVWTDTDEWSPKWRHKGDRILHTDLKNWADVFVVAPLSANTLGKIAAGLADNLLTSVARAWPVLQKPMILAPAMNTDMWAHPVTKENLLRIAEWTPFKGHAGIWVEPQDKLLPCGDSGIGAMAKISDIADAVVATRKWDWPLVENNKPKGNGLPVSGHPGSFGHRRKHDVHTGIDLYCVEGTLVFPVEPGSVVDIIPFTGPKAACPSFPDQSWWNDTSAVLVQGKSGLVVYGEIKPDPDLEIGQKVWGQPLGTVIPVLPKGKERPDIPGHSRAMLHLELWSCQEDCNAVGGIWKLTEPKPNGLQNPTRWLTRARPGSVPLLQMPA